MGPLSAQMNVWYSAEKRQKMMHFSLTLDLLLLDLEDLFLRVEKSQTKMKKTNLFSSKPNI